jgi:hypothetical protein
LALDFINWMLSALEFWILTSDYPVYLPIQPAWEKAVCTNPLFSNDPFPVMQATLQVKSPFYTLPDYDMIGFLENL